LTYLKIPDIFDKESSTINLNIPMVSGEKMRKHDQEDGSGNAFSPSMSKKISAALEWALLERELEALRATSYEPSVLFGMKVVGLENQIEARIDVLERLGVSTLDAMAALKAADDLLIILSNAD
jgi:hypothetical protein